MHLTNSTHFDSLLKQSYFGNNNFICRIEVVLLGILVY